MEPWMWMLIALGVIVVLAVLWIASRRRRTSELRDTFGPEYDRTVGSADRRRDAEAELAERRERREAIDVRPLTAAARDRYAAAWAQVQTRFVDDPATALRDADVLVIEVMRERGYPVERFDERADTVSVDHPEVVEHYRAGRRLAGLSEDGRASTEDMRQAVVHYRAMFDELLDDGVGGRSTRTG
jgi:hypothetical protein